MKIAVAITNHNQHYQVRDTVAALYRQTLKPSAVYVLSDGKPYWNLPTDKYEVIPLNNSGKFMGRCGNRNSVIRPFLESDNDVLVFMDGDCSPLQVDFLETYAKHMASTTWSSVRGSTATFPVLKDRLPTYSPPTWTTSMRTVRSTTPI